MWNCYFDDYIVFERPALARHSDMCVTVLFAVLGWDVAQDKDDSFSELRKVLGLEIDLSEYRLGLVRFQNTESRRSELYEDIKALLTKGTLNPKEGARLRGRMLFAENQLFGRRCLAAMRTLSFHLRTGKPRLATDTSHALEFLMDHFLNGRPREISCALNEVLHVYVDAAYEPGNMKPGGLGGVLVDPKTTNVQQHFSLMLTAAEVCAVTTEGSKNPIFELECLAMLAGVKVWANHLRHKHVILFTDNNGSLGAMISGVSRNSTGADIVHCFDAFVDSLGCIVWFERVNTASNPADEPSRNTSCSGLGEAVSIDLRDLSHMLSEFRSRG